MSLSRREVLLALAGVGVVGCSASPPGAPPPEEPLPSVAVRRPLGPRVRLEDGPTPRHVLLADRSSMGGGSHLTVYDDGLATYYETGWGDRERRPYVRLLRISIDELRALQGQISAPGFVGAAPTLRMNAKDGGRLRIVAGAHKLSLIGAPNNLPPEVAAVRQTIEALEGRLADQGQDAFSATEPRLLAIHTRWHSAAGTTDRLIVWANGVLDYRIIDSNTPGEDDPDPIVRLEQTSPADVAELATLLADESFITAPSRVDEEADLMRSGTTHFVLHAGPKLAEVPARFDPSEGVRPVLVALGKLLARLGAAPDEPAMKRPPSG